MKNQFPRLLFGAAGLVLLILAISTATRRSPDSPAEAMETAPAPARAPATKLSDRAQPDAASKELVGMRISSSDPHEAQAWAQALSRNEHELTQRLSDLKHVKRAEVISFTSIADNKERLSTDQLPLVLKLPSFEGGTMEVEFDHLSIDGPEGGTLAGKVVGRPDTSVVLGFHNGETSGLIEGPGQLVFLDAFERNVAILRELDAAAHAKDFKCDCLLHKAAAAGENPGDGEAQ